MDPQIYDANATIDLSNDKQNIVRQLSEMFYGYSLVYIRGICEACLWNVDLCIDKLIGGAGGGDTIEIINNHQQSQELTTKVLNYSQAVQKTSAGAVPKTIANCQAAIPLPTKPSVQNLPATYSHVYNDILKGYKVLVLMRGAPGSGKSHLAKSIVKNLMPGQDWKDFVFGADDYFFDVRGRYRYNVERLEDAHKYCQTRAREKMLLGYSPVIIDNTNNLLWEMMVYVQIGVENGYIIEIVEPVTSWRHSAGKLAVKNTHNVPKQKIQRMLDRFEVGTSKDLVALLKETQYTVPLPQLRTYPPPPEPESEVDLEEAASKADSEPQTVQDAVPEPQAQPPPTPTKIENDLLLSNEPSDFIQEQASPCEMDTDIDKDPEAMWPTFEPLDIVLQAPKSPRKNQKGREENPEIQEVLEDQEEKENNTPRRESKPLNPEAASFWGVPFSAYQSYDDDDTQLFPSVSNAWQAYEQEATNFWGVPASVAAGGGDGESYDSPLVEPMVTSDNNCGLLQLLKEGVKSINVPSKDKSNNGEESGNSMVRHRIGCVNENDSFVALRQIYPNKPNAELWDLFVKCNGSIDWAVDILLKDEDSVVNQNAFSDRSQEDCDDFDCYCDRLGTISPPPPPLPLANIDINVKPQRQKTVRNRNVPTAAQVLEIKEAVEKSFVLGEEHYSSHVKKIRNKRNNTEDPAAAAAAAATATKKTFADFQVQTELDLDENENSDDGAEGSELIEVNLGEGLIGQLSQIFISETPPLEAPEKYKTNVFMPKSLARELYVLWMESVYNQQEEQRQQLLKEDEEFARLLKNPKYQNLKQPPENIKELLDMEYAWMIYKQQQEQYNGVSAKQHPNDLASHLTRMKLCEIFPNIPRETLLDILAAHNNKFSDTVEVLKSSIQPATVDHQVSAEVLIEKARNENEMLKEEDDQKTLKNNQTNSFQKTHSKQQTESPQRHRSLSPEEAKRLALSEFEETRNYAAHHCQLRAECYQKAKDAIQRGNSGVAVYYSQIANLHKRKIDIYNHRAANCIMEVHDLTQNNPDFIDLHYLHVVEAVACLDIFVDRHIAKLRSIFRSFKYVFIITGRGLHSAGGVSMIKTRVKSRLKERNLKWSEVNPGLLKVKIFSASKYSKNL